MTQATLSTAGVLLITVVGIEYGGYALLQFLTRRTEGYMDNPTRRGMFTAGHAHAGVLVLFSLVALVYIDQAGLSGGAAALVRSTIVAAPILMPAGFFLSIASPRATRPNRLVLLIYLGALSLAVGVLTLGINLL
jgi:hypothetical protein